MTRAMSCAAVLGLWLIGAPAQAGVYSDDLGRCLVKATTPQDKSSLMQWIFSTMTLNAAVKPLSAISPQQREAMDRSMAVLTQRLILVDCRAAAADAIQYEGASAFESSFQTLGEVATRSLMTDPDVAAGLTKWTSYADKALFEKFGQEVAQRAGAAAKPAR